MPPERPPGDDMRLNIAVMAGDGIGVEVTRQALRVLGAVGRRFGHQVEAREHLVGASALEAVGEPLPASSLEAALEADAILFGAVGSPRHDANPPPLRPEAALFRLRKVLGLYANLRPARVYPQLVGASPLRPELVAGTDVLVVRELTGGLYFGEPRGIEETARGARAVNTMVYEEREIERIARVGFEEARRRRRRLASVDKLNVLEVSQLWRRVVERVHAEYPDVEVEHLLVDNAAMQVLRRPRDFDVILSENLFGDILSDELGMITGSIGLLASASLNFESGSKVGLFEPVHGSAPDIAGRDIANPLAAIGCVALLLRYSFGLEEEAAAVERAVAGVIEQGHRTADMSPSGPAVGCTEMGDLLLGELVRGHRDPAETAPVSRREPADAPREGPGRDR